MHQLPPTLYALEEDKPTVEWIKSLPKADLIATLGDINVMTVKVALQIINRESQKQ